MFATGTARNVIERAFVHHRLGGLFQVVGMKRDIVVEKARNERSGFVNEETAYQALDHDLALAFSGDVVGRG